MFLYLSIRLIFNKYELIKLNHPIIIISFFLAIVSLLSSFLAKNFYASLSGSPQIGQGVFWYFDLTIMLITFSSISQYKHVRVILFLNLIVVTFIVSFFTFFPFWKGLPISFYYFSDYLCFYGVLNFILFTTLTKKLYLNFLAFIFLGIYISLLDNRAATLFWITSFLFGLAFYSMKFINSVNKNKRLISFLFSDGIFVFSVITISLLTLLSSVYFWASDYNLPFSIKDTLLDAPVVRGKIIENSLYSLDNAKSILIGSGWGVVPSLLLENMNSWQYDELRLGYNLHFHTHNELVEHIVSVGIFGGVLYLLLMFYVFRFSKSNAFESKLGWLLFFKITCFWFLWTGTLTLFAVVLACFIASESKKSKYFFFLNENSKKKNVIFSIIFLLAGTFLFY